MDYQEEYAKAMELAVDSLKEKGTKPVTNQKLGAYLEQAQRLGFTKATKNAHDDYARAQKMLLAYADYPVVTKEQFEKTNRDLINRTSRFEGYDHIWQSIETVSIADYASLPPNDVLVKVDEAQKKGYFDGFEVAYVVEKKERIPDPIIFGRIKGCGDHFFIAQWGDDIKLSDFSDAVPTATS